MAATAAIQLAHITANPALIRPVLPPTTCSGSRPHCPPGRAFSTACVPVSPVPQGIRVHGVRSTRKESSKSQIRSRSDQAGVPGSPASRSATRSSRRGFLTPTAAAAAATSPMGREGPRAAMAAEGPVAPHQSGPASWRENPDGLSGVGSFGGGDGRFVLAVLGDLHLEPGQMPLFFEARQQARDWLLRLGQQDQPPQQQRRQQQRGEQGVGSEGIADDATEKTGAAAEVAALQAFWGQSSALPQQAVAAADNAEENSGAPGGGGAAAAASLGPAVRVVQLGDVGGYNNKPGSAACFAAAVAFLDGFGAPRRLSVTGNHDLEGAEFESDAENLAAWQAAFGQRHYWAEDLGGAVCVGVSTVRFRDAENSCHEVWVDSEQYAWLEAKLEECARRAVPVFLFSHAPPMGSGLTSLQEVHVRNRCAWLNHSDDPHRFLNLVHRYPNVKLWFSGHFHLSHDYEGSVSRASPLSSGDGAASAPPCLFVQTGVMGGCHRDGRRHSRILVGDSQGYRLMTLDHGTGELRTDVSHQYANEKLGLTPQRLWCSTLSLLSSCPGGGAFSPIVPSEIAERDVDQFPPEFCSPWPQHAAAGGSAEASVWPRVRWHQHGRSLLIAEHANQLVQYDVATRAPIGTVCDAVNGREVGLILGTVLPGDDEGREGEGTKVIAIELIPNEASERFKFSQRKVKGEFGYQRIERNKEGAFWQVFQPNKWRLRREKAAAEAAAAASAATAVGATGGSDLSGNSAVDIQTSAMPEQVVAAAT